MVSLRKLALALAVSWAASIPASAQPLLGDFDTGIAQSPILVIEFDRAFGQSEFGKGFAKALEQAGSEIAAENREIEAELTEEEKALTEQRKTLEPQEFRKLAEAFDQKVQKLRREQDSKARALAERQESARREFLLAARPVLNKIMQDAGAVVVLDKRGVFVSVSSIDVTDKLIAGINQALATAEPAETDQNE